MFFWFQQSSIWRRRWNPGVLPELNDLLIEAGKLARSYGHDYIGVEHVFLSFRQLPAEHIVTQTLAHFGVDLPAFYAELESEARVEIKRPVPKNLPHTPRLTSILTHARLTARLNGYGNIHILHVLNSIVIEKTSLPAQVLRRHFVAKNPDYQVPQCNAEVMRACLAFGKPGKSLVWQMPRFNWRFR